MLTSQSAFATLVTVVEPTPLPQGISGFSMVFSGILWFSIIFYGILCFSQVFYDFSWIYLGGSWPLPFLNMLALWN